MLTLSADLVFRDYAQAAYRMRGIGKGQKIVLFVTPEVQRLLTTEAAMGRGVSASTRSAQVEQLPKGGPQVRASLEDVTAWLLLNSFRSERVQFELWCLHCAQNVWRKEAFLHLQSGAHMHLGAAVEKGGGGVLTKRSSSGVELTPEQVAQSRASHARPLALSRPNLSLSACPPLLSTPLSPPSTPALSEPPSLCAFAPPPPPPVFPSQMAARKSLSTFRDVVDNSISNSVPQHVSTRQEIMNGLEQARNSGTKPSEEGGQAIRHVLQLLDGHVPEAANAAPPPPKRSQSAQDAAIAAAAGEANREGSEQSIFGQEQEQQQEQEQEQEKEQQQQQQKEQEQEVEEPDTPAKEKYSRDDEHPVRWPLAALAQPPSEQSKLGFFPASEFAVHRAVLEKRGPLHWPSYVQLSSDHTHPRWRFNSHHRLKSLIVMMEWQPQQGGGGGGGGGSDNLTGGAAMAASAQTQAQAAMMLSDTQRQRLQCLVRMYDVTGSGVLNEPELRRILSDLGLNPEDDERARVAVETALSTLDRSRSLSPDAFCEMMRTQTFLQGEPGRYWVALSLREAESLRGALHIAMDARVPLVAGARVAVGIRLPDETLLDAIGADTSSAPPACLTEAAAFAYPLPTQLQLHSAIAAYRFIDSQLSYAPHQIRLLLRMLRHDTCEDRRRWFVEVCSTRRRPQAKLERRRTNLETVLCTEDEYPLLMGLAARWRMGIEMQRRGFGRADLYHAFNGRRDGLMSCSELAAGFEWLQLGHCNQEDVHAFMRLVDGSGDGLLSIDEWNDSFPMAVDSDPSTQLQLASLVLQPKPIRELHEGATDAPRARPVPRAALAAFKFKIHAPKGFTMIWSNKGGTSAAKLSIWSADVDSGSGGVKGVAALAVGGVLGSGQAWKRNAKARISLGHYAVAGYDPPGKGVRVLEVTDTAAPNLSQSEHLEAVVEQLLPNPLRYRLIWQEKASAGKPLFLWRASMRHARAHFEACDARALEACDPPRAHLKHLHRRRACQLCFLTVPHAIPAHLLLHCPSSSTFAFSPAEQQLHRPRLPGDHHRRAASP